MGGGVEGRVANLSSFFFSILFHNKATGTEQDAEETDKRAVGGQSGREGESCVEAGAVPGPLTCKLMPPEPCCRQHMARPCSKKSMPKYTSK